MSSSLRRRWGSQSGIVLLQANIVIGHLDTAVPRTMVIVPDGRFVLFQATLVNRKAVVQLALFRQDIAESQ